MNNVALTSRAKSSPIFDRTIDNGTFTSPGCAVEGVEGFVPQ